MKKIIAVLLSAALLAAAFSGCSRYRSGNYPVSEGGAEIKAEPTAVVSLAPYISEIIYGLALEDKLAARSTYCAFNGNVRELPDAGTVLAPDTDKIIEVGAKVVFAAAALPDDAAAKLDEAGIAVCVLAFPTGVSEVTERTEQVARVLKGNNRVEQTTADYLDKFNNSLEYVRFKLDGAVKKTGVFILADGAVATGDTLMGAIMELAGIENVAAEKTDYTMSKAEIAAADPEIIIVTNPPAISFIEADAELSQLPAALKGYIYEIGNEYAECGSPEVATTLYALAYAVHGELMAAPDTAEDPDSSIPSNPELSVPAVSVGSPAQVSEVSESSASSAVSSGK